MNKIKPTGLLISTKKPNKTIIVIINKNKQELIIK
jgi:hypothetical protein